MSLYRRLWIAISLIMLLSFIGSFVLSNLSSRQYFEQQLALKNMDNANALALLLSSSEMDPLSRELLITAQFDTGHYQFIRFINPDGETVLERIDDRVDKSYPAWLADAFPIDPPHGIAQISTGWQQIGTLTLASHIHVAYTTLWNSSLQLLGYFLIAGTLLGLLGSVLVKIITRPLDHLVGQAQAITERRFVTHDEPDTPEFKAIAKSMNTLSLHVKKMLEEESARLDSWRVNMQYDSLTSLMKRPPLLAQFNAVLARNDASSAGTLMLIQLQQLAQLNQQLGRKQVDHLLKRLGCRLNNETRDYPERLAGRLNGSDMLVVAPGYYNTDSLGKRIYHALLDTIGRLALSEDIHVHCVAMPFRAGDQISELLRTLDSCLKIQPASTSSFTVQTLPLPHDPGLMIEPWQLRLDDALNGEGISLQCYPATDRCGQLHHLETCARLHSEAGPSLVAGVFMPSLRELGWCHRLDQVVLNLALAKLKQSDETRLAIGLSGAVLRDPSFLHRLYKQLLNTDYPTQRLQIELCSSDAFLYLDGLKQLCHQLKPLGCQIGLKHLGHELAPISQLADTGIDYVKIDGAFIRQLSESREAPVFIQGICSTLHTLGIQVLAEQVATEHQWQQLLALGIDGGTGPLFNERVLNCDN